MVTAMKRRGFLRRGVTLVEVLSAAGMLALLTITVLSLSMNVSAEWANGTSQMMADNDASLAIQAMGREIRDGLRASVSNSGTQLNVVFPAVTNTGDFDTFTEGATVQYYFSNGFIYRRIGAGTPMKVAKNVISAQFEANGPQVGIRVTARQQQGTKIRSTTLRTQVALRNEPPS
jgi:hypothetical protein